MFFGISFLNGKAEIPANSPADVPFAKITAAIQKAFFEGQTNLTCFLFLGCLCFIILITTEVPETCVRISTVLQTSLKLVCISFIRFFKTSQCGFENVRCVLRMSCERMLHLRCGCRDLPRQVSTLWVNYCVIFFTS